MMIGNQIGDLQFFNSYFMDLQSFQTGFILSSCHLSRNPPPVFHIWRWQQPDCYCFLAQAPSGGPGGGQADRDAGEHPQVSALVPPQPAQRASQQDSAGPCQHRRVRAGSSYVSGPCLSLNHDHERFFQYVPSTFTSHSWIFELNCPYVTEKV